MKKFRLIGYALVMAITVIVVHAQDMGVGQWTRSAYHLTAKGTYTATFTNPSVLNSFDVNISNAGTSWVLVLKDRQATPLTLWRWVTADGVGNFHIALPIGIKMANGIAIESSGTTAGVADVALTHRGAPNPSATPFATPTATATATATSTATATATATT